MCGRYETQDEETDGDSNQKCPNSVENLDDCRDENKISDLVGL